MEHYWTIVGDLILRVRKMDSGWEASIAGPANFMDVEIAKKQALRFATSVVGKEAGPVVWQGGPENPK